MRWFSQFALNKTPKKPKKLKWDWTVLIPDAVRRIMEEGQTLRDIVRAWGKGDKYTVLRNQFTESSNRMDEDRFRALLGDSYPNLTLEEVRQQIRMNAKRKSSYVAKDRVLNDKGIPKREWDAWMPQIMRMIYEDKMPMHQISKAMGVGQTALSNKVKRLLMDPNSEYYDPKGLDVLEHNSAAYFANQSAGKRPPDYAQTVVELARQLLRSGVSPDVIPAELDKKLRDEGVISPEDRITPKSLARMIRSYYKADRELFPLTVPENRRRVKPRSGKSLPPRVKRQLQDMLRQSLEQGRPSVSEIMDAISVTQDRVREMAQMMFTPEELGRWIDQQQFPWREQTQTEFAPREKELYEYAARRGGMTLIEWVTTNCLGLSPGE